MNLRVDIDIGKFGEYFCHKEKEYNLKSFRRRPKKKNH